MLAGRCVSICCYTLAVEVSSFKHGRNGIDTYMLKIRLILMMFVAIFARIAFVQMLLKQVRSYSIETSFAQRATIISGPPMIPNTLLGVEVIITNVTDVVATGVFHVLIYGNLTSKVTITPRAVISEAKTESEIWLQELDRNWQLLIMIGIILYDSHSGDGAVRARRFSGVAGTISKVGYAGSGRWCTRMTF